MELDAKTVAIIVGIIAASVAVLGKIADKVVDALITVVKERRASANGGKAPPPNGEVLSRIEILTDAIRANTVEVREIARVSLDLKGSLAQGILILGANVERSCDGIAAHAAEVQAVELRILGGIKDSKDQVLFAVRGGAVKGQ